MGRIALFDNLKGILIILVVTGHFFNGAIAAGIVPAWHIFDFIYLFHMPLFIMVSGIFCKSVYSPATGFRLGIPLYYLALCWAMYVTLWIAQAIVGIAGPFNLLTVDGSMPWYLMALSLYCLITPLLHAMRPSVAIVLALCLSLYSGFVDVGPVLSANRVLVFLPFFVMGYYLRPEKVMHLLDRIKGRIVAARVGAALFIFVVYLGFCSLNLDQMMMNQVIFTGEEPYTAAITAGGASLEPDVGMDGATDDAVDTGIDALVSGRASAIAGEANMIGAGLSMAGTVMCCVLRAGGFGLALLIGLCLVVLAPRNEMPGLTRTGRHSLQVYILHAFVSYALTYLGTAAVLYQVLPAPAASVTLILLSVAVSLLLGWPNGVQTCFDRLKRAIEHLVTPFG